MSVISTSDPLWILGGDWTGEGDNAAVEKEKQKLLLLSMQKEKEMRAQEEELRAQKKELEAQMKELEGKLKKCELEAKTAKKLKNPGDKFGLCSLSPEVFKIMKLAGFTSIFSIYPDEGEALARW